jgi:histidinol phosphatase-like enzyme
MWHELRGRYNLMPEKCIMIGDKAGDLEFGYAAGFALSVLVLTGDGAKTAANLDVSLPDAHTLCTETVDKIGRPLLLARNLEAAVQWLLSRLSPVVS